MLALTEVPFAAMAPLVVVALGLVGYCWWDLAHAEVQYLPKWAWALIIVVSVPFGAILYLLAGRRPTEGLRERPGPA